jgi:hypothetical protein
MGSENSAGRIIRVGDTVRRPAGYWTPAVHALLNHLDRVGFESVPRVIGVDADTEILSFVDGVTPARESSDWISDGVLTSVGRLLRRYHDAVATFRPPTWARWQSTSIPTTGTIVCHNDLYPGNVVFQNGRAAGLIDFDFAHPADPLWDLAMAAWHWVPLSEGSLGGQIPTSEWPLRLRLFVDAYGVPPAQRGDVPRIAADLNRRMRDKRAKNNEATDIFDRSLDALDRGWGALVDRLS